MFSASFWTIGTFKSFRKVVCDGFDNDVSNLLGFPKCPDIVVTCWVNCRQTIAPQLSSAIYQQSKN